MNRHVSKFADTTISLRLNRPIIDRLSIDSVRVGSWHDIERHMVETEGAVMRMLLRSLCVQIDENNKICLELVFLKINIASALRQVDVSLEDRCAGLYLNPKLDPWVSGFNNQITSRKVVPEYARVIRGNSMHPAFGLSSGFADSTVRLRLAGSTHYQLIMFS